MYKGPGAETGLWRARESVHGRREGGGWGHREDPLMGLESCSSRCCFSAFLIWTARLIGDPLPAGQGLDFCQRRSEPSAYAPRPGGAQTFIKHPCLASESWFAPAVRTPHQGGRLAGTSGGRDGRPAGLGRHSRRQQAPKGQPRPAGGSSFQHLSNRGMRRGSRSLGFHHLARQ